DHPDLHSFPTRRSSDLKVFIRKKGAVVAPADEITCGGHSESPLGKNERHASGISWPSERLATYERRKGPDRNIGESWIKSRRLRSEEHTSELQSRSDLV